MVYGCLWGLSPLKFCAIVLGFPLFSASAEISAFGNKGLVRAWVVGVRACVVGLVCVFPLSVRACRAR